MALVNQEKEGKALRATLSGYFILSAAVAILGMLPAGRFGTPELELSLWMIPGILLGFWISKYFANRLSQRATRAAVLGLSALAAMILIIQQIGR